MCSLSRYWVVVFACCVRSHRLTFPFYRGKQVSEDDKEPDEDLKKVGTCSHRFPLHLYTCTAVTVPVCHTPQPFFPSGTVVKFQGCGPDASMTKIKVCCSLLFSCAHVTVISPVSLTFSGVLPGICCSGLCGVHQWRHQGVCE